MNKLRIIMLCTSLLCTMLLNAQDSDKSTNTDFKKHFYISGDLGLDLLDGDNTEYKLGMDGNIGIGYQIDKYLGIKANMGYGKLNGSFKGLSEYQDISIEKLNYFEFSFNLTVDLTNIIFGYNPDRKFGVVPHIGLGQIQYRTSVLNNDGSTFYKQGYRTNNDNVSDASINGRKIIGTIPMGLEINYSINQRWNVYLDYTVNYTDSDFIEGVGLNNNSDWFHTFNLGASYKLNKLEIKENNYETKECYNYWYMMLDGGASFLFGDNEFNLSKMKGNYNLGVGYNFNDFYRIYAKVGYGDYAGLSDEWHVSDGSYLNASINLSANVLGLIFKSKDNLSLGLYPHIGIGEIQYRATNKINTNVYNVKQVGYNNENTYNVKGNGINERRVAFTFPLGIELVYNVNENTDLYADATSYLAQSDLLDCIIDGNRNDALSTFNVGLRYKFNRNCYNAPADNCLTPDEVKQAIQEAIQQQKAEEDAAEEKPACITQEDIKQAIKEAIEEYEASKPNVEQANNMNSLSSATVINNNYSDISFPKNGAQKVKTQTNIDAINRASDQVDNGSAVNRVIIEGYASPEGDKDFNDRLALQRAEQAAEIIKKELGEIDQERIEITTKGADWEGLYASLANSDIEDKDMIIDELKSSSNPEETLQELLNKYPQIRQLLPQLRRASVVITTIK